MSATRPVVLHVLEALSSGTSRHVVNLVRHIDGVEHHVAVPPRRSTGLTDLGAVDALRSAGAKVSVIDMRRTPQHPVHAKAVVSLTRLARDAGVDVLHGHSAIGGALARLVPLSIPKVYTPHGLIPARSAQVLERILGRVTTRVIAVSDSEGDKVVRRRLVPPGRCLVIPNGVVLTTPIGGGRLRAALGLSADVPLVGCVGRATGQKRPFDFIAMCRIIAAKRPEVRFVLVADGPLASDVDAATADMRDCFTRLPYLTEIASTMGDLDVFVLLAEDEGGPYVPLEAAVAGVPLVLSDVVGNCDVVDAGSGVLVPLGRPGRAAAEVLRLLASPAERQSLTGAMNQRLMSKFDVRAQAAAHVDLYRELAARSSRQRRPR